MTATPGQAAPFHWHGTWEEFDAEVRRRWIESSERLGLDHGMPNAAAALAAQEPHAAPVYRLACGCPIAAGKNPLGNWTCVMHGPTTMIGESAEQPAPELAAAMRETRQLRTALRTLADLWDASSDKDEETAARPNRARLILEERATTRRGCAADIRKLAGPPS